MRLFIILFFFVLTNTAFAQKIGIKTPKKLPTTKQMTVESHNEPIPIYNNALRWHIASVGALNASFGYERKIAPRLSLNIGLSGLASPKVFERPALTTLSIGRFSGFAITPELRFYVRKNTTAFKGFYAAPYFRYSAYKVPLVFSSLGMLPVVAEGKMYLRNYSAGVQLGYQWLLGRKIVVDWFFFGPKITRQIVGTKFNLNVDKQYLVESIRAYETYDILRTGLVDKAASRIQSFDTDRVLDVKKGFTTGSIRTGLGIGIRF
jgi:hypothetical protein